MSTCKHKWIGDTCTECGVAWHVWAQSEIERAVKLERELAERSRLNVEYQETIRQLRAESAEWTTDEELVNKAHELERELAEARSMLSSLTSTANSVADGSRLGSWLARLGTARQGLARQLNKDLAEIAERRLAERCQWREVAEGLAMALTPFETQPASKIALGRFDALMKEASRE